jgi:hypothetical protein
MTRSTFRASLSPYYQLIISRESDGSWSAWVNGPCPRIDMRISMSGLPDAQFAAYSLAIKHFNELKIAETVAPFENLVWHEDADFP